MYHNAHKELRQKAEHLQLCYLLKVRLVQTKHGRKDTWKAFPLPVRKGWKTLALQNLQISAERNDLSFLLHLLLEIRKLNSTSDLHSLTVAVVYKTQAL